MDPKATLPVLMDCVGEGALPVKLAAEQCLVYFLGLKKEEKDFDSFLKAVDVNKAASWSQLISMKWIEKDSDDEDLE